MKPIIIVISFICVFLAGCAEIPIKDAGLEIGKDTTAAIDDVGVARLTRAF